MIRGDQELEIREILGGESIQADTEDIGSVAVFEDQVAVTVNVEGENPIQLKEDDRSFQEQFK